MLPQHASSILGWGPQAKSSLRTRFFRPPKRLGTPNHFCHTQPRSNYTQTKDISFCRACLRCIMSKAWAFSNAREKNCAKHPSHFSDTQIPTMYLSRFKQASSVLCVCCFWDGGNVWQPRASPDRYASSVPFKHPSSIAMFYPKVPQKGSGHILHATTPAKTSDGCSPPRSRRYSQ